MKVFKKLLWFFKQEKKQYIFAVTLLLLVSILAMIVPLIIAHLIDGMIATTLTRKDLLFWIGVLLLIAILQYIMRYFWRMSLFGTSAKLEKILRQQLFEHFTTMDTPFFHENRTGDLMAHATNDMTQVRMVAGGGILTLTDSIFQGATTLFMMFFIIDWRLSLVAVLPMPLLALVIRYNGKKIHSSFKLAQEAFSKMNDKVQESMSGVRVIKAFGQERLDNEDFATYIEEVVNKNNVAYRYSARFRPSIQFVTGLSNVLTLFFGGYLVSQGQLTIGALIAFFNYVSRMSWPMIAVGNLVNILERGLVSYERIESLLKQKPTLDQSKETSGLNLVGQLEVAIDCFSYTKNDQAILKNIHFSVPQGETLGIVGKTGAGKSSILKLLMRDYDVYQGQLSLNGYLMSDTSVQEWRSQFAIVTQDNFLFSTNIRNNITFGLEDASQEEIERAARLANIHNDIMEFPNGYDTLVGERGVSLSGGQKQRIAIARALILNPQILILDDSLSAVDAKTEEAILRAVRAIRQNKTTIITAHRLSSVMHANQILVIEQGQIIERGTHDQLMANNGWYKEVFDRQQIESESEVTD